MPLRAGRRFESVRLLEPRLRAIIWEDGARNLDVVARREGRPPKADGDPDPPVPPVPPAAKSSSDFARRVARSSITARVYTQTLELLDLHQMDYTLIGKHGGASRVRKLMRLIQRTSGMRRFGKGSGFDLAIAHGSNDIAIASRLLGIPEANMHDYEFAVAQHHVGCRLAKRVIFPDSVPPERLKRFGVGPEKLSSTPGIRGVLPLGPRGRPGRTGQGRSG